MKLDQFDAADTADREVAITRLLDAPRELVFQAWTDPAHIDNWWGPSGFKNATIKMDVKPGGVWKFMMHGPDGVDYPNLITYLEVVPPERLVYAHGSDEQSPAEFHTVVTFEAQGRQTKMTMRAIFPTAEALQFVVREHGAIEGGQQTVQRLVDYLPTMKS